MLPRKAYPKEELVIDFKAFWSLLSSAGDVGDPARGVFLVSLLASLGL